VQFDPIKSTLKAPGSKRLKLEFDELLSNFAFKSKLRRYSLASPAAAAEAGKRLAAPLVVGRCRLTLSNSR
jgi:hypothetical protein